MKHLLILSAICFALVFSGCSATAAPTSSAAGTSSSTEAVIPDTDDGNEWDDEKYLDFGYRLADHSTLLGYGQYADYNGNRRDAYVPYGGSINLSANFLQAVNHGVSVSLWRSADETTLDALNTTISTVQSDTNYPNAQCSEIQSADDGSISYSMMSYTLGETADTDLVYCVLYASIQDGDCLNVWFEFYPPEFDDSTQALLQELEDHYEIGFPDLPTDAS